MREAPSSSASGRLPLSVARGWVRSGTCRGSRWQRVGVAAISVTSPSLLVACVDVSLYLK
ncbi:hypothetical protein DY000_02059349 [Brassica cretica]|uniref:Uncharacterized protein n=1 Tax=Brassica cretica TaxID=69181 RepID=A0ABQ7AP78_BRACR|nr:hypothetical protein DY000_02059349 [Brassica cretica]